MIPFLAPIRPPNTIERHGTKRFVEMQFLLSKPNEHSIPSLKSSDSSAESSSQNSSRPASRQKKKSVVLSQPTSARSEKSSPIPVNPIPPPASWKKNKLLETSPGMMAIFGEPETKIQPDLSKPGPEWYEGAECDTKCIELPPDVNCPAEKFLRQANISSQLGSENFESLPGPDIEYTQESEKDDCEEEEEASQKEGPISACCMDNENDALCSSSSNSPKIPIDDGDGGRQTRPEYQRDADETSEKDADSQPTNANGDQKKQVSGLGSSGMPAILIQNAQIVNDDAIFVSDVLVVDGLISNISSKIEPSDDVETIDASGKMLLPAGIDAYTQFCAQDSVDDVSTSCKSAVAGGTTTVVEIIHPRSGESIVTAVSRTKKEVENSLCNIAFAVVISSWDESIKSDMEKLANEGINNFVIDVDGDDKLFDILEFSKKLGVLVRMKPENKSIVSMLEKKMVQLGVNGPEGFPQSRPEELESAKISNIAVYSKLTNCPLTIVSLCSAESLGAVEKARSSGTLVHVEIPSFAVVADGSKYMSKDMEEASLHMTDVPLRVGASSRLVSALCSQPLAICTSAHKAVDTKSRPNAKDFTEMRKGTIGAEERMSIVWEKAVRNGHIDPMRFVAVTSTNAAKMFNLYPKKGRIAVGADADLVILDGNSKRTLSSNDSHSKVASSLYYGQTVHAKVFATIISGKIVYKDAKFEEAKNGFIPLSPNSPYLFSTVAQRDKFCDVEKVEREVNAQANNKSNGNSTKPTMEFDRDRNRKHLMESSIDFGGSNSSKGRRSTGGGRSTGFW